jgi:uncharacterized membrane protein HdeD (DUF308 family)
MPIETTRPAYSVRCTLFFGWSLPIFMIFSFFNYREDIPLSLSILLVFCILAIALSVPGIFQVYRLRDKKESKLLTALFTFVGVIGIILLLESKGAAYLFGMNCTFPFLTCYLHS